MWHLHPVLLWFSVSGGGLCDLPGSFVVVDNSGYQWTMGGCWWWLAAVVVNDSDGWKESQ